MKEDLYDPHGIYEGNDIHHTAIIYPNVIMGKGNKIGPYCVIGSDGEIRDCDEFKGIVVIGDNNVISELVTIQRPKDQGSVTEIGSNNILMAHSHVGHDVKIGNNCEISTSSVIFFLIIFSIKCSGSLILYLTECTFFVFIKLLKI